MKKLVILLGFVCLTQGISLQAGSNKKIKNAFSKQAVEKGWDKVEDAFTKKYYMIYNLTGHTLHVMKGKILPEKSKDPVKYYDFTESYCTLKPGASRRFTGTGKAPHIVYAFRVGGRDYIVPHSSDSEKGYVSDLPKIESKNLKRVMIVNGSDCFIDMSKPTTTSICVNVDIDESGQKNFYFRYN